MKKKPDPQRKSPKQGRSKAIVDAIFEATIRILPKIGSQGITTKKIADLAGISVGSLYQYFPNKESVLAAIIEIGVDASVKEFEIKLHEIADKSMEDAVDIMVNFTFDLFLKEKEKIREIYIKAPELGRIPMLLKSRRLVVEKMAEEMKKHYPGHPDAEYQRVSFIATNSLMGVVQIMLYDEEQVYTNEELALEMKTMLKAYFKNRIEK